MGNCSFRPTEAKKFMRSDFNLWHVWHILVFPVRQENTNRRIKVQADTGIK
jgi:hypothetical protein